MKRTPADATVFRRIAVDTEALETRAKGDDRIPVAISSEHPVVRDDAWSGVRYLEVLDHSPDAIDLARAGDGLPFLVDHDPTQHVGRVEDVRLGSDRKLRGMVRFGQSTRAQEIARDFQDGIRTDISVGYRQGDYQDDGVRDGLPVRRYQKWQPMEVSSVAIPADITVGAGRSAEPSRTDARAPRVEIHSRHSESPMQTNTRAQDYADIKALADALDMADAGREAIARGMTLEQARNFFDERLPKSQPIPASRGVIDASPKEQRAGEFMLGRWIAGQLPDSKIDNGRDREILEEYGRHAGVTATRGGYVLPIDLGLLSVAPQTRTAMLTTGSAASAVFSNYAGDINILRNRPFVVQMGATTFPGMVGNAAWPRQTGDVTATWVDQGPASDVADSSPSFDQVTASPKGLQAMTILSKLTLAQTTPQMEEKVRQSISAKHALAIDLAAINGSGSSFQPTGILTKSGVNVVSLGTNGAAPTYANLVDMETAVANVNADQGALGYLSSPGIRGTLRKTLDFSASSAGRPVWTGGVEGIANGYKALATNQIPQTLTKGTGTNLHAIVFGDWSQIYIAEWNAFELVLDPYTLAGRNLVRLISYQALDIAIAQPTAFTRVVDAIAA